jgi:glutaredoxin
MKLDMTSHLRRGAFLGLALLLSAGSASAQMYKWVDAAGKTHFSDTPPPANAKTAPIKGGAPSAGPSTAGLPFALANAVKNFPVTLYTTASCGPCDAGRSFLRGRGIPFSEKTVTTSGDSERVKAAGGDGMLPLLVVGSAKSNGYEQGAWGSMLDLAQYPATKMLPSSYQYPAAVAANPSAAAPQAAAQDSEAAARAQAAAQAEEEARRKAQAPATAPPGFRF